jgi:capsular polysaccharide export protein
LVFKAHPLEDGRASLGSAIRQHAHEFGINGRVHYLTSGKLGALLDGAKTAITVNSTSAQQVLWRGIPLKALGRSVYQKPEFVSHQPMADFFANPMPPDADAYRTYRAFLLETSQFPGSYYSARGRRQLIRRLVDALLSPADPYGATYRAEPNKGAAEQQHI